MKQCTFCKAIKQLTEFSPRKDCKSGYRAMCKLCMKPTMLRYRLKHPDRVRETGRKHREEHREYHKNRLSKYQKDNKVRVAIYVANRRAVKLRSTPPWLTVEHWRQITQIYFLAAKISELSGIPHEVDHIFPLKGLNISGLHVPWNLQILTAAENLKKSNRIVVTGGIKC